MFHGQTQINWYRNDSINIERSRIYLTFSNLKPSETIPKYFSYDKSEDNNNNNIPGLQDQIKSVEKSNIYTDE